MFVFWFIPPAVERSSSGTLDIISEELCNKRISQLDDCCIFNGDLVSITRCMKIRKEMHWCCLASESQGQHYHQQGYQQRNPKRACGVEGTGQMTSTWLVIPPTFLIGVRDAITTTIIIIVITSSTFHFKNV